MINTKAFQVYAIKDGSIEYIQNVEQDRCDCTECNRMREKSRYHVWALEDLPHPLQNAVITHWDSISKERRN